MSQGAWPTFTTVAETSSAAAPSPVVATAIAAYRPPLLDWPGVTGADGYQVFFSVANANSFTAAGVKTNQTAWTYTGVAGYSRLRLAPPARRLRLLRARLQRDDGADGLAASGSSTSTRCRSPRSPRPPTARRGPAARVEYDTPTFRWNPVNGAGWYRVYLATDPLFTNITKTYDTMFTSLTPSESLPDSQAGQATYWFVRPCYTNSYCGPFDESVFGQARAFRKVTRPVEDLAATLPTPSGPGAPVDNSVTFTWKDYLATNRLNQTTAIAPVSPCRGPRGRVVPAAGVDDLELHVHHRQRHRHRPDHVRRRPP